MLRRPMLRTSISLPLAALAMAACAAAGEGDPTSGRASPSAPVSPTPAPTGTPRQPSASPTDAPASPSGSPSVDVVRFETPVLGRITADGVAVHVRPGLDEPLIEGTNLDDGVAVPQVRLSDGDMVGLIWGPMLHDGHTWYAVRHHDSGGIAWVEGWIAADFVEAAEPIPNFPDVAAADGQGRGGSETVVMPQLARVYVDVHAAPMPGEERCAATVTVVDPAGQRIEIGSGEVTELTTFFSSPLEQSALSMDDGGEITLEVDTDCSWAALVENPQG